MLSQKTIIKNFAALIYAHYNYVRVDVMILGIGVKILEGFIYGI